MRYAAFTAVDSAISAKSTGVRRPAFLIASITGVEARHYVYVYVCLLARVSHTYTYHIIRVRMAGYV